MASPLQARQMADGKLEMRDCDRFFVARRFALDVMPLTPVSSICAAGAAIACRPKYDRSWPTLGRFRGRIGGRWSSLSPKLGHVLPDFDQAHAIPAPCRPNRPRFGEIRAMSAATCLPRSCMDLNNQRGGDGGGGGPRRAHGRRSEARPTQRRPPPGVCQAGRAAAAQRRAASSRGGRTGRKASGPASRADAQRAPATCKLGPAGITPGGARTTHQEGHQKRAREGGAAPGKRS